MTRSDTIRGCAGCGLFFALIAGCFGATEGQQAIAFVFGVTYGGLWINHE